MNKEDSKQQERLIAAIGGEESLTQRSTGGGTQKKVVNSNLAVGTSQECISCLIHCPDGNSGDVHITIANEVADVDDFLIPKGQVIPMPINNVSSLHFYGTSDSDLIYILWRN